MPSVPCSADISGLFITTGCDIESKAEMMYFQMVKQNGKFRAKHGIFQDE
jgi:hypothetical protein